MSFIGKSPRLESDPSPISRCRPAIAALVMFEYDGNLVFEQETIGRLAQGQPAARSFTYAASKLSYATED